MDQQLLNVATDIHGLHITRETSEQELYQLHNEISILQQRLEALENAQATQSR